MSAAVIVFIVAVVASAVAHVVILVSVVRRASDTVDAAVPRPRLVSEIVWALIPALALALVFTATWARVRDRETAPSAIMRVAR